VGANILEGGIMVLGLRCAWHESNANKGIVAHFSFVLLNVIMKAGCPASVLFCGVLLRFGRLVLLQPVRFQFCLRQALIQGVFLGEL